MDMGIIAAFKLGFTAIILRKILCNLEDRDTLREKAQGVPRGTKELDEGHDAYMCDVCEMVYEAWQQVLLEMVTLCLVNADILPRDIHAELIGNHRKLTSVNRSISGDALVVG